jgi:hypothetical protein
MQKRIKTLQASPSIDSQHELEFHSIENAIMFAQKFATKPVYTIRDASELTGSFTTAYRRLHYLKLLGLAEFKRGLFSVKTDVVSQPVPVLRKLIPSLIALRKSKRFGRLYTENDINFAKKHLPRKILTTLDYAAWELTKFQTPSDFFIYVDDIEQATTYLKNNNFSEGKKGHIILLPKIGNFDNEIERIYLDCIARGGRSIFDAIAINLLYEDYLTVKGQFPIEYSEKVREDLPPEMKRELLRARSY